MTDHDDCFESLAAYALGALPDAERERVAAHVETCPVCAEDAAALERAAATLIDTVPVVPPPPELRGRIMAVVASEAALLRPAASPRRRATWSGPLALRWAATAAALLVAGGVVGAVWPAGGGGGARTIAARASAAQRAWVELRGHHAQLAVDRLAPPPGREVYELWVQHGDANPRPAGTFVVRSGRVDVSVPVGRGDRVMVTAEPRGGSPQPTSAPVVVSQVA